MAQNNAAAAVTSAFRTPELKEKILFTLLCLVVYRIGAHITAPGVDVVALTDFFRNQSRQNGGGLLGLYDLFTGGQLSRATVFALGIMPYISASIFLQIAGAVIPQVEKMQKDEEGKRLTSGHATRPWRSRRCRPGASRCSPSRCRAQSPRRASPSGCRWRSSSPSARSS
jgi:preprotein translocase subunit SecY